MQYKLEKKHFFCKLFGGLKKKLYLCTLNCDTCKCVVFYLTFFVTTNN